MKRLLAWIDPFTVFLLGTVAIASLAPARGQAVWWFEAAADCGIFLLFFLHGAKLSPAAIKAGALNWRLQGAVLLTTFAFFPLLGWSFYQLPWLSAPLAMGLLFLTLLPSTVQSSIAFTSMAGGNVAAAVCAASFSNIVAIALTPALTHVMISDVGGGDVSAWASVRVIAFQLLLPFLLGQLARPLLAAFLTRRKTLVARVDRSSILLVVYTAFSAAVVDGLWNRVSALDLLILALASLVLLGIVLAATWYAGRGIGLAYPDRVVLLFCGSKKSLASGVPIAGALFPAAQVGLTILPLMLFHQIQLIACAIIARRLAASQPLET